MDFTNGRGMDAVILAVGSTKANDQALSVIGLRGRILFFAAGYPAPELHVEPNQIHYKEYELIGTFGSDPADYQIASVLLSERRIKVDKMISHTVPLDDVQKAFELAVTPGNYRVSVSMW
jgi:L-iditol 2-dehydrogenase